MDKGLLKEAKKLVKNPDVIVDAYDLTFEWFSKKMLDVLGYKKGDNLVGVQTFAIHAENVEKARKIEMDILTGVQGAKRVLKVRSKSGKGVKISLKIFRFYYKDNPYMVGVFV